MNYRKREFKNNSSKLCTNNILIIIMSVALIACISILIYFFVNKKTKESVKDLEQNESSASGEIIASQESSESLESSPSESSESLNDSDSIKLSTDYSAWNSKCPSELILVNANNKLPSTYNIELTEYDNFKINKIIEKPLKKMIEDARIQSGLSLWLSSVYRSVDLQTELFQDEVDSKLSYGYTQQKAEELAAQVVARPGFSEHNTGLAVDFNGVRDDFKETEEYKWLCDNSYKYGFVLRYPEEKKNLTGIIFEPWHFRFVGVDVATKMKNNNMCFEEYVSSQG